MQRVDLPLRDAPALDAGQVHVWLARPTELPLPGVVPARDFGDHPAPDADARSNRGPIGNRQDGRAARVRQQRIAQKFLLRLLLGAYLQRPGREIRLKRGAHGKPELASDLAGSGLHFNLSHAGGWLAIAVATGVEIGIDIEPVAREVHWPRLAQRWFSPAEAEYLAALGQDSGRLEFLRRWSLREALVKAMGLTMAGNVGQIAAQPEDPARLLRLPEGWATPAQWSLKELQELPGLTGWLATPEKMVSMRQFHLTGSDHPV